MDNVLVARKPGVRNQALIAERNIRSNVQHVTYRVAL